MTAPASQVRVSGVRFTHGSEADRRAGLLGWLRVRYGALELDGLALRRSGDGRFLVTFPSRRDSAGREHPLVRPLDYASRRDLEAQILRGIEDARRRPA